MRYLDVLHDQLVAASSELSRSQPQATTPHPPARRRVTSRRLALTVVFGVLGLSVVSGAIAEATGIIRLPSPGTSPHRRRTGRLSRSRHSSRPRFASCAAHGSLQMR